MCRTCWEKNELPQVEGMEETGKKLIEGIKNEGGLDLSRLYAIRLLAYVFKVKD